MERTSFKSRTDLLGAESLCGRVVLDDNEISVCYEFIKFVIFFWFVDCFLHGHKAF